MKDSGDQLIDAAKLLGGIGNVPTSTTPTEIRQVAEVLGKLDGTGIIDQDTLVEVAVGFFSAVLIIIAQGAPDAESLATAALHFLVDEDCSITDILTVNG